MQAECLEDMDVPGVTTPEEHRVCEKLKEQGWAGSPSKHANFYRRGRRWDACRASIKRSQNGVLYHHYLQTISPKPGEKQEIGVRRSVGLPPGTRAHLHEANPKAKFPNSQLNPDQIILGQGAYSKTMVAKVLGGEGKYQPMWRQNDVLLPLIDSQTGEFHLITINADQLPELTKRLEQKKPNKPFS